MIVTNLNNPLVESYKKTHPRFEAAFEALKKLVAEDAADGKYEIDGKNIFASISTYQTKPTAEKKFEIHKDYIDIQYIVSGREIMGNEALDELTPMGDYKPDAQFFYLNDNYDKIYLSAGELAVFFPNEPHGPGIAVDETPSTVKKIVVKVLA